MKTVLLITVTMDGYEKELIQALEDRNYKVDLFERGAKIHKGNLKIGQRLIKLLVTELNFKFLRYKLDKIEQSIYHKYVANLSSHYDYILDFAGKGRMNCLKLLRQKYNTKFILYLWDDIGHNQSITENFVFFDDIFTYNRFDAAKYKIKYRPNFFTKNYNHTYEEKFIDIFYKGTARNRSRAKIIQKITEATKYLKTDISLFIKGGWLKNLWIITDSKFFYTYCSNERLDNNQLAEKYKYSKALIDITFKNQKGLSLRPIQAIASNCKLITTNKNIQFYDIYNRSNIFILEENMSNLDEVINFMKVPYIKIPEEVKFRYSINGFIDDIFNE